MNLRAMAAAVGAGRTVTFRASGSSMQPLVWDGEVVTVEPVEISDLSVDDIVLAKVKSHWYLHKIVVAQDGRFKIGNNRGHVNGWASEIVGRKTSAS